MLNKIVLCVGIFTLGRYADCAISWTTPVGGNGVLGTYASTTNPGVLAGAKVLATTDLGGASIAYNIVNASNPNATFAITGGNGQLSLAADKKFDYPTMNKYILHVTATDGTDTETANVTIKIEGAPVFGIIPKLMMDNKAPVDTKVVTLSATDHDSNGVSYEIQSGDTNTDFTMNSTTGVIKVAKVLNHNTTANYTLVIKATDNSTLSLFATASISIEVCEGACPSNNANNIRSSLAKSLFMIAMTFIVFRL